MRVVMVLLLPGAWAAGLPRRCKDDTFYEETSAASRHPSRVVFGNGSAPAAPTPRLSPGCAKRVPPSVRPGEMDRRTIEVSDAGFPGGKATRNYRVFFPADYSPSSVHPLLFHLHGFCGSDASLNKFHQIGAEHGAITVYPRGMGDGSCNSWNNNNAGPEGAASCTNRAKDECYQSCSRLSQCGKCNCYTCADDPAFFTAMLAELAAEACIDLGRVYIAGYSNGGGGAYHLPTELPDMFAAALSVHGQPFEGVFRVPQGAQHTALLHLGGTGDRVIPIDGSPSTCGFVYVSQAAATRAWADVHDCGNKVEKHPTPYDNNQGLGCERYTDCRTGTSKVVKCTVSGGHGHPSVSFELAWWFLLQHSRPSA
eukprot:TRINITY_DN9353_c0_g1_i1.p1 TRINITY_DN9353_c0_g1~~TRINITY_DN9353_c0_g1_i1.p1  ORF type:complete len:368 (+),score=117.39 TRINITY_DN9353_c0_g1_i1:90-1193(+)